LVGISPAAIFLVSSEVVTHGGRIDCRQGGSATRVGCRGGRARCGASSGRRHGRLGSVGRGGSSARALVAGSVYGEVWRAGSDGADVEEGGLRDLSIELAVRRRGERARARRPASLRGGGFGVPSGQRWKKVEWGRAGLGQGGGKESGSTWAKAGRRKGRGAAAQFENKEWARDG
jgi:hypothetical protein